MRGKFLALRKEMFSVHENHPFHHNLTSKTPHQNHPFSKYPLKKHSKTIHLGPQSLSEKKPKKQ
jgi:hypothetical protein